MANKINNISDLIHRVASSCLQQQPLARGYNESPENNSTTDNQTEYQEVEDEDEEDEDSEQENGNMGFEEKKKKNRGLEREMEMEALMGEMFESVSAMKKAYVSLQEAHNPWDLEKMGVADAAVIAELRKLGSLKERFRRRSRGGGGGGGRGGGGKGGFAPPLREVVAPYEAAMAELKREVKAKEMEVENLKEKLRSAMSSNGSTGKKGKFQSKRRVSCGLGHVAAAPAPELYEGTMSQVKETSKTFTSLLLSLMRSARWDITAAVRSIESATTTTAATTTNDNMTSVMGPQHAKYALESYICQKMFHGFDHETFYIDGSLSSLLNPEQFRRDCFTQFRDMKSMEPAELLGILPTCHYGKFCTKKFLAIVHPKMEESLFGNLDHHNTVSAGNHHPRSQFYGEFLRFAKAVWLLHLLAFALDPAPCHFQASKGAEFNAEYMESVVRYSGGRVPVGQIVGFPISPGFKLGNGSVIKARVYLVSRT